MESILLSNIAAIIVKDILIDRSKKPEKTAAAQPLEYPLLASDDDEDFAFFLRQQQLPAPATQSENSGTSSARANKRPAASTANSGKMRKEHNISATNSHEQSHATGNSSCLPFNAFLNKHNKQIDVNLLNKFGENDFEANLHMSKVNFLQIFQTLRQYLLPTDLPRNTTPQSVFSLALWKLTTDEHFEEIARKFHISTGICQQIIRHFWRRISGQYETLIQWPNTAQKRELNMRNFEKCSSSAEALPHIFGVVALKRLDVFLEDENEDVAVVLQIICNAEHKVIDCFLELVADYAFDASPIGQMLALNIQTLPTQSYLVGDTQLPLKPYLMRPYEQTPCTSREHRFNVMLEPALRIGRQVLDTMAKRFNALYALEARNLHEMRKIVDTVCALHNLCVDMQDDYVARKQEELRFQWADANAVNDVIKINAGEQNEQGREKRAALLEALAHA